MNEADEARAIHGYVNRMIDLRLAEFVKTLCDEVTAKVSSTSPLTVYLRGDVSVFVSVGNPMAVAVSVGDLVRVRFPNFRNDANRYILFKL